MKDERCDDVIFNGGKIALAYTLKTDDITKCENKIAYTPYMSRIGNFERIGEKIINPETGAELLVKSVGSGIAFTVLCDNPLLSEWGICFPFNFIGKFNGGGFKNQFLVNAPYVTSDRKFKSFYMTKPNGNDLLIAVTSDADGWKIDYSPFHGAAYMINLKIFADYDRAFGNFTEKTRLDFVIYPVSDYDDALNTLSEIYGKPFMKADLYSGSVGDEIALTCFGNCDKILEISDSGKREIAFDGKYKIKHEGVTELVPCGNGESGAGITVYGYSDIIDLYIKSMNSVDLKKIEAFTDGNLCEHQCWASATLRLLLNYKDRLSEREIESYENRLREFFAVLFETDENKAKPRTTIFKYASGGYPAYNVFRSPRVQEQFFGMTILLDAYKYFKEDVFYEYLIGASDCLLDNYQKEDGRLETSNSRKDEDYTTVCCAIIPIIDVARFLKGKDDERSRRYFDSAKRMAEYLFRRNMSFPTEGGITDLAEPFQSEGSMACTALSMLYYCKNVEMVEKYMDFAKEILDLHEAWVIRTPLCNMNCSTLRWWETLWEGDADGPAINAGHAWTIWRAEADWLYYDLSGDEKYLYKAKNGFGTNFAKIDKDGNSYAIYNVDEINGGGFAERSRVTPFRIAKKFAETVDCGLSRYVWIRANDSILEEKRK